MDLGPLIDRLLASEPGSPEAEERQHDIEGALMAALRAGGRAAGEALVESLAARGYEVERLDALPCMWRLRIPPPRVLELWFTGGDRPVIAALSYRVGAPWGTRAQKRAAKRQAAFYSRYEDLCGRANADGSALSPRDRLILAVGDFEGDVNNGGFGQYLDNKGPAQARRTLRWLKTIGAKRSAVRLASALGARGDAESLARLSRQFFERPEDLSSLAMVYIGRRSNAGRPSRRSRR